ncbi:MAG: hypothetical protein R3B99_26215 [Polyangiales bacterium]
MRQLLALLVAFALPAPALACVEDEALGEAAGALALAGRVDDGALRDALREAHTDLPSVRALEGDEPSLERTLRRLASEGDAPLVCGRATGPRGSVALVAFRGGALAEEDPTRFRVELARGFDDARLLLEDAEGELREQPVATGERVEIPAELIRPVRVQLVASGPSGPRPVAERLVTDGTPSAEVPVPSMASDEDVGSRVAALRALAGVGELRDNRLLREAATAHAERICADGAVRHEVDGRDPEVRLRRRGIVARVVGEVAARARDEDQAFDALLASPSHRSALVDRRFTDVGVGTARRGANLCVVVDLAAWPRYAGR